MSTDYAETFTETIGETEQERREREAGNGQGVRFLSRAEFLAGFVPPDYLVDGVLQRRFIYTLTAKTGDGKTAIALTLARMVACRDRLARFGPHAVQKGKVLYLVGENPDDVRGRIIGADSRRDDDPTLDQIYFIPGIFDIGAMRECLIVEARGLGGVDLIIVDTSAAYFLKDDENSNPQIGAHARMMRSLTLLPGGPTVLTLCHPGKWAKHPSELLPRGGGAHLAEVDGNLTAWRHDDDLITFHHGNKFRGPGFEPITFRLEKFTTPKLVDSKGRLIPCVEAVAITEQEEEHQTAEAEHDEDTLLTELRRDPDRSVADLARACGWLLANGEPHKSKTYRVLERLEDAKLIKKVRGRHWHVTKEGNEALEDNGNVDETVADRSGAVSSKKPFHALRGMKLRPTIPCAYCGKTGDIYQFADGRLPKGQRHHSALHEGCAEPFFTGKPSPKVSTASSNGNDGNGISLMITVSQRERLKDRGYTDDDIHVMTPAEAHRILREQ
jgi:AAA domain